MSSSYISSNKIIPNNMSEGLEKQKASYTARGSAYQYDLFLHRNWKY